MRNSSDFLTKIMILINSKYTILFYLIADLFRGLDGKLFPCKNNQLIELHQFCDGFDNCGDGSDESYGCNPSRWGRGIFACQNKWGCRPISARCDAKRDCSDGSDELYCDKGYFQCTDGSLIGGDWFCDQVSDCADDSDESLGCSDDYCGRGNFTCNDQKCLPISVRCDAKSDCADGSDEINCGHAFNSKNCPLQEGKYLCKDRSGCIPLANVCDGINGCLDGSEENITCHDPTDTCDLSCPHPCWRSPYGPLCFCNYTDSSHPSLCNKVEDCDLDEDVCQQRCVKFDGAIQCSCHEGYKPSSYRIGSCLNEVSHENVLLYSDERNIVAYDMSTLRNVFIQNENNAASISAAHSYVYWSLSSNNASKIFKTKLLYQQRDETIYSNPRSTSAITCIAVDWMTNNTFFTSQTTLSVCNENGSACAQLKHNSYGIECVALLPRKGLMFWIENTENKYSKARINISSMDGSDEQILVDENLHFSNHLVADESSERIYWIDCESAIIESIKYNGKQRKMVLPTARSIACFTVFEGILYYALKSDSRIFNIKDHEVLLNGDSNIKKIHIFNPHLQKTKISNPCARSPCSGLCLLRPASPSPGLNYTCLYKQFKTDIDDDDVSTRSTSTSKDRGRFETLTEKDSLTVLATDVLRKLERQQSTFGNNVTIMLVILIVTLILLLCVNTIFSLYYIRLKTKRTHVIMDNDLINLDSRL